MGGPSIKTSGHETLETIGMDQNTHPSTIGDLNKAIDLSTPEPSATGVPHPVVPDTKRAYESLAVVENLQEQLLYVD